MRLSTEINSLQIQCFILHVDDRYILEQDPIAARLELLTRQ